MPYSTASFAGLRIAPRPAVPRPVTVRRPWCSPDEAIDRKFDRYPPSNSQARYCIMRCTSVLRAADSSASGAAGEPQSEPRGNGPRGKAPTVEPKVRDRRLALVAGVPGAELQRLGDRVRGKRAAERGGSEGCRRLAGGAVDCGCEYCCTYWTELARRSNGDPG